MIFTLIIKFIYVKTHFFIIKIFVIKNDNFILIIIIFYMTSFS
jgi:hypothetical protein